MLKGIKGISLKGWTQKIYFTNRTFTPSVLFEFHGWVGFCKKYFQPLFAKGRRET